MNDAFEKKTKRIFCKRFKKRDENGRLRTYEMKKCPWNSVKDVLTLKLEQNMVKEPEKY